MNDNYDDDGDIRIAVREIKMTLTFTIPKPFHSLNVDYKAQIDEWINRNIMKDFNMGYPSTELKPMFIYVDAEEISSGEVK